MPQMSIYSCYRPLHGRAHRESHYVCIKSARALEFDVYLLCNLSPSMAFAVFEKHLFVNLPIQMVLPTSTFDDCLISLYLALV